MACDSFRETGTFLMLVMFSGVSICSIGQMCNIYDSMIFAWREHKKTHSCKALKQFELSQAAFDALTAARKSILSVGRYSLPPGWDAVFYGTPVLVIDGSDCFVVDHEGGRSQLGGGSSISDETAQHTRRITDA